MASADLNQLAPGQSLDAVLAVRDKRGMAPYTNGFFYTLVLGNRTGQVTAKFWGGGDEAEIRGQYDGLEVGDVVRVVAKVSEYRGGTELSLDGPPEILPGGDIDPREFIPSSEKDTRALARRLIGAARSIEDEHLRALVLHFWEDPELQQVLLEMPAAKSHHHNWLGGFVEHLHGALQVIEVIAANYDGLDRDLLVTGVLLHDIGKVREYVWGAAIDFTDEGRLLGHIPIGDEMVRNAIATLEGFPPGLALKVRHMVLSHHGRKEWGSAVEPRTPEAYVLHHIENLDAQVTKFLAVAKDLREAGEDQAWSPKLRQFLYLR